jgi:hypothetical protein
MEKKKTKIGRKITIGIVTTLIVLFGAFYIYTLDYYRADDYALEVFSGDDVNIKREENRITVYPNEPIDENKALIFYPGGKVEAIAYIPLLEQIANRGITCILVEMPFNLAVFNINAADSVYAQYPEIEKWYIAGHSLGGAMASSYMADNSEKVNGLILLGAYPVNDAVVPTLAIYGSEDIQLDLTKLEDTENKVEIEGGNHAYFGNYGEQKGDGTATISREEQQSIAVEEIVTFIQKE